MTTYDRTVADAGETLREVTALAAGQPSDRAERVPTPSLDALAHSAAQMRARAGPAMHELAAGAGNLARDSAMAVRRRATLVGEAGAGYIREHPMRSVLLAAAAGAGLAMLLRLLASSR
jgi:ElaB/YqjD/DUF883 family membrane-anchored ribosome-binding protein